MRGLPFAGSFDNDVQIAPDGTYVGGEPELTPDGTYVGGEPELTKEKYSEYIPKVPLTVAMNKFEAWRNSPESKAIALLREESTTSNAVVIEGM